ncbi:ABC transporter ATP-binding protein, partial [Clostridium tertium]
IGPNGCGKSTILKTMSRIMRSHVGAVYLNGKAIHKMSTKDIAKDMAILPQTPEAPSGLTVHELVSYGRFPHQSGFGRLNDEDRRIIKWALEETGMAEFAERPIEALSGGQRQRVWIAMALAQGTELLLLDEPT